ncbi:hypothetical protein RCH23_000003 [Cryobacterium sp. CAN_C3]|nr:hypothetical protein [Cryobacterium sp. CAN_C3]
MIIEGRRLQMRFVWAYVVLIPIVTFAFAFPLFLAMRERALTSMNNKTDKDTSK